MIHFTKHRKAAQKQQKLLKHANAIFGHQKIVPWRTPYITHQCLENLTGTAGDLG